MVQSVAGEALPWCGPERVPAARAGACRRCRADCARAAVDPMATPTMMRAHSPRCRHLFESTVTPRVVDLIQPTKGMSLSTEDER